MGHYARADAPNQTKKQIQFDPAEGALYILPPCTAGTAGLERQFGEKVRIPVQLNG
jgi:hypothetical protein